MPQNRKRKASSQKSRKTSKRRKTSSTLRYPGAGASLGSVLGGALGGAPGAAIGSALGGGLHSLVHAVTGLGDYTVNKNTLLMDGAPIHVINSPNSGVIVRHREYIQDVISSPVAGQFKNETFMIQPGDGNTFPWLAAIAENFQEYKLRGMLFEFKSLSADALNSTNTALGSVIMATNYNPVLPAFTNKFEMEQYQFVTNGRPSINLVHPIECAPSETPLDHLYIRTGAVTNGLDPRFYDFGKFQIATTGMQGTSVNVGELWVTYEIELYKPRSSPTGVGGGMGSAIFADSVAPPSNTNLFGGLAADPDNTLPCTVNANILRFPDVAVGSAYLVDFYMSSATPAATLNINTPTYIDCELYGLMNSQSPTNGAANATNCKVSYVVIITGNNPSMSFAGTFPSGGASGSRLLQVTCWDKQVTIP